MQYKVTMLFLFFISIFISAQTESFKLTFNHQALPVKQIHLITSNDGAPNTIVNHMAYSTRDLDELVEHLQKNKVDYWTDEGKKNVVGIRKDGVRQVKI